MNAHLLLALLLAGQGPLGGGPSGRIGGVEGRVRDFWRLLEQNPAEALLFGGAFVLFILLIRRAGSD